MNEDRTQPNPDWRTPTDGEDCGWGYFDDGKGPFRLVYNATRKVVVRVYADGTQADDTAPSESRPDPINYVGPIQPAPHIYYTADTKPRRFRFNEVTNTYAEVSPSNDSP